MKVQILEDLSVEVEKPFARELEEIRLHKWDELFVEKIFTYGERADIVLENGNTLLWVPVASFSTVENK